MKVRGAAGLCIAAAVWCCSLGAVMPGKGAGQGFERKTVLVQAQQSYYNLRREGLVDFQCDLLPDWEALLAEQRKSDPAAYEKALAKLRQLHFQVLLGADNAAKVTHDEVSAESKEQAESLRKVYGGIEQMITGIYQTSSIFLLTSPFPEVESEYRLEKVGPRFRLSYKEGTTDVVTTMLGDYSITEMKIATAEFTSSIRPQFTKNAKGLLLAGYDSDYRDAAGSQNVNLKVLMRYQAVAGLQLFQEVKVDATLNQVSYKVDVAFAGCRANKR
jgi:hypothetical protein